jgi:hypothetical protein
MGVGPVANTLTCTSETVSLSASTNYYFRVLGNDSFGPANDYFGTISLQIVGTGPSQTVTISVGCVADDVTVANLLTQIKIGVTCGSLGINLAKTFTVDWLAGIPA